MKRIAILACGLCLAFSAHAADEVEPGLALIKDLGRLNGQALACAHKDTAAWIKVLMLNHAPKTRSHGEAYEAGTQETFAAHARGAPCPDKAAMTARLEDVTARLKAAFPATNSAPK
jgi:hypothetical protein